MDSNRDPEIDDSLLPDGGTMDGPAYITIPIHLEEGVQMYAHIDRDAEEIFVEVAGRLLYVAYENDLLDSLPEKDAVVIGYDEYKQIVLEHNDEEDREEISEELATLRGRILEAAETAQLPERN